MKPDWFALREATKRTESSWAQFSSRTAIGDIVEGTLITVAPFGLFVELDGAVGLIRSTEIPKQTDPMKTQEWEPGTVLKARVLAFPRVSRQVDLSLRLDHVNRGSEEGSDGE